MQDCNISQAKDKYTIALIFGILCIFSVPVNTDSFKTFVKFGFFLLLSYSNQSSELCI